MDFGARFYDPATAIFLQQDPLAEKYYNISPYAYCANNPVNFVDPDGMREWPVNPQFNGFKRRHENNYRNPRPNHNGVDINLGSGSNDFGAPVFATHDGKVTRIVSINDDNNSGGNRIQITSEDGQVSTYYMHLNEMEDLKMNDLVSEGDMIGTIGGSGFGKADGHKVHLHYELKIDGEYVNPVIDAKTMIDPQVLIAPIDLGSLNPSIVTGQKKVIEIEHPKLVSNTQSLIVK